MTLNPITYTENVVGDFLKYQLTTYGFADLRLRDQLRRLLSLDETRRCRKLMPVRKRLISVRSVVPLYPGLAFSPASAPRCPSWCPLVILGVASAGPGPPAW